MSALEIKFVDVYGRMMLARNNVKGEYFKQIAKNLEVNGLIFAIKHSLQARVERSDNRLNHFLGRNFVVFVKLRCILKKVNDHRKVFVSFVVGLSSVGVEHLEDINWLHLLHHEHF